MIIKVLAAAGVLAIAVGCAVVPSQRIAACMQQGGNEAACAASEWDYKKVNPLPQYDTGNVANFPRMAAALSDNGHA